jgi:transposase
MRGRRFWVGLDAGERRVDICVLDAEGAVVLRQDCDATAIAVRKALAEIPRSRIDAMGIEAGAGTHLVRELRRFRFPVCIFESRKASRFLGIRRNKTDSNDAKGLADLARLGQQAVSQVCLKSPETQLLRVQLISRTKLIQHRLAAHSTLRSLLALHGANLQTSRTGRNLETQFSQQVRRLRAKSDIDLEPHLRPLVELCKEATAQIRQMDRSLVERAMAHPVCSQLMTVPGVGPVCAVSFYTAVEDPTRFTRSSDVGAYFGLTPKVRQSGDVSRISGISKMGNRLTRGHLVSAATALLWTSKAECDLRAWGLQLIERVGGQRARVAVARKLATVMLAMWKTGQPFDPQPTRSERFRLRRLGKSVDSVDCLEAEPLAR